MSVFNAANHILLAKSETTRGTDPTLIGSDAVLAFDIDHSHPTEMHDRTPHAGDMSPWASVPGASFGELKFKSQVRWNGNVDGDSAVPAEHDPLFRACGCTVTYTLEVGGDNAGSVAIAPSSLMTSTPTDGTPPTAGPQSMYAKVFTGRDTGGANQTVYAFPGCVGTFEFGADAGGMGMFAWDFKSKYAVPASAAAVTPTYDSESYRALPFLNHTFSIGAWGDGVLRSFSFKLNSETVRRGDMTDTYGVFGWETISRAPTIEFSIEDELVATYTGWADMLAGAERAITVGPIGSTNGNNMTLTAPAAQIVSHAVSFENGIKMRNVVMRLNRSAGDDEFLITFS